MLRYDGDDFMFYLWLCRIDIKKVPFKVVYEHDEYRVISRDETERVVIPDRIGRTLWQRASHKWMTGMEMYFILCEAT